MKVRSIIIFLVAASFISGCVQTSELVIEDKKTQSIIVKKEEEPVKAKEPEKEAPKPKKGLGISLDDAIHLIDEFIDVKASGNVAGIPRFSGRSGNSLVVFEAVGRKDDMQEVSITFLYPSNINESDKDLNTAIMTRFLRNCAPAYGDWFEKTQELIDEFDGLGAGMKKEDSLHFGGRSIKVIYDKSLDMITIAIIS
ncbi:MAG: hypothetical protein ABIG92_01985 [Candidatus Omnitrophota bacterium]